MREKSSRRERVRREDGREEGRDVRNNGVERLVEEVYNKNVH